MKVYEIGTGYTSIPAKISAATEIVVEQLTKELLIKDINVTIIDICDKARHNTYLPIEEVKVPSIFAGSDVQLGILHKLKRVVYSLALAHKLKKILRENDEDMVFHFHNQYNLFFFLKMVPKSLRDKCIMAYTNHSGIWRLEWQEIESTVKKRYFQEAVCMQKADLVYVLNEETKNNVMQHLGVKENHIVKIDNGVNIDLYYPVNKIEKENLKKRYGFSGKTIILQVGSVYENKGQKRAIEMLLPLMKSNENLIYAYVGGIVSVEYQQEIQDFVKENELIEQVKYLGMVSPGDELNEIYNIADVTIIASRYESFGMVIIESMAAGVPVLVDVRAPFSMGDGCILYDINNFEETVKANVLDNIEVYAQHCENARRTVVEQYSWEKVTRDYTNSWNK